MSKYNAIYGHDKNILKMQKIKRFTYSSLCNS